MQALNLIIICLSLKLGFELDDESLKDYSNWLLHGSAYWNPYLIDNFHRPRLSSLDFEYFEWHSDCLNPLAQLINS